MRINLVKSSEDEKKDYQNIPISTENISRIPNSICTDMCLDHIVDYLTEEDFLTVIGKVRHKGTLEIRGVEAPEVFRKVSIGLLEFSNSIPLLIGKVRLTSALGIKTKLEEFGFVTEIAAVQDSFYYIKAKRP